MEKVPLTPLPSPEERKKLRLQMGLSYREAAKEIGVTYRTLWRWEHEDLHLRPDSHRKYQAALRRWKEVIESYH